MIFRTISGGEIIWFLRPKCQNLSDTLRKKMPVPIPLEYFINILEIWINFHNLTTSQKSIIIVLMGTFDNFTSK